MESYKRIAEIKVSFGYSLFMSEKGMHLINIFLNEKGSLLTAVAILYSISIT